MLFWIDTLCVPTRQRDFILRQIQIDKMASIYKGSVTSLVLDAEMLESTLLTKSTNDVLSDVLPSSQVHPQGVQQADVLISSRKLSLESRARIACSVWMSRSWCLQEGQLSPSITIQFENDAAIFGRLSAEDGQYCESFPADHSDAYSDTERALQPSIGMSTQPIVPDSGSHGFPSTLGLNERVLGSFCQCVDIRVQRSFYDTFFDEHNGLSKVWNEVVQRSTTMSEDVPVIMSNIMDLDNKQLLAFDETAEMLQALFLSLNTLPISLFFTARSYSGQSPRNSWIPTKVGPDILSLQNSLVVRPSYLLYPHSTENTGYTRMVYKVRGIVPIESGVRLHVEGSNEAYKIKSAGSGTVQVCQEHTSTCLMIEDDLNDLTSPSRVKRAALFYIEDNSSFEADDWFQRRWEEGIRKSRTTDTWRGMGAISGKRWLHRQVHDRPFDVPRTGMTFIGSLELSPCRLPSLEDTSQVKAFSMELIEPDHEFRIFYGTIGPRHVIAQTDRT